MQAAQVLPELFRRADRPEPVDYRRLRAALASGTWVRVCTGAYCPGPSWVNLSPLERHRLMTLEVSRRLRGPSVLSHFAAAACWGIDILGAWPDRVDVTIEAARGGRSSGHIRRWPAPLEDIEWTEDDDGRRLTTPAQTALDLARVLPFTQAVAMLDQALWADRPGAPLTSKAAIVDRMVSTHRGDTRALRALEFAETKAANPRESEGRVLFARLGFEKPRLQERRVLRSGRLVFGDYYFPEADHWCELDGNGKYLSPEYTGGRSPEQIVLDEKNRENEIRREVRGFSRLLPSDLDHPRRVFDILTADGLRNTKRRP
jgi:hypothetical protein